MCVTRDVTVVCRVWTCCVTYYIKTKINKTNVVGKKSAYILVAGGHVRFVDRLYGARVLYTYLRMYT